MGSINTTSFEWTSRLGLLQWLSQFGGTLDTEFLTPLLLLISGITSTWTGFFCNRNIKHLLLIIKFLKNLAMPVDNTKSNTVASQWSPPTGKLKISKSSVLNRATMTKMTSKHPTLNFDMFFCSKLFFKYSWKLRFFLSYRSLVIRTLESCW